MSEVFLRIVNMSIAAGWIVLAVLLLRLVLKRAPRWITIILWGMVAFRLVCPFTIESVLSLIPSAETISPEIMTDKTPTIDSGIPLVNETLNPIISESFAPDPVTSINPLQIWIPVATILWLVGIAGMLLYTVISYFRVRHNIKTAVLLRDNVFQSEAVVSPFVLGLIKPKIYLPFYMNKQDMSHVVAHEQAHIRRKDHWWKPLGFLLLALHWFNPFIWLACVLLCRDIEIACDEKVIKKLSPEQKADYSQALLTCSVNRRMIATCPLAFGEVSVKNRVKSVLNYKKPAFWMVAVAVVAGIAVALCLLTSPETKTEETSSPTTQSNTPSTSATTANKPSSSVPDITTQNGALVSSTTRGQLTDTTDSGNTTLPTTSTVPTGSSTTKPTHTHRWGRWITTVAPTCMETGLNVRECADCSEEETQVLAKTGCQDSGWIVETAATATTEGKKYKKCLFCDKRMETATIPATGTGHVHKTKYRYTIVEATCTESGSIGNFCSCGDLISTETVPPQHTVYYIRREEPTCSNAGHTEGTYCGLCNVTLTESVTIPATGNHNYVTVSGYAATCTKEGITDGVKCSVCHDWLQCQESIPKTAHAFVNGVCKCGYRRPSEGLAFTADGKYATVIGIGSCTDTVINIPETYNGQPVYYIGTNAFLNNTTIREVYLPDSVRVIRDKAFSGATNLQRVRFPSDLNRIDEEAFYGCTSLQEAVIYGAQIWKRAFYGCTALKTLKILGTTSSVWDDAFVGCSSLTSVTFGGGLSGIGDGAFSGCAFDEIDYYGSASLFFDINLGWSWTGNKGVTIHCIDKDIFYSNNSYSTFPKRE